MHKIHPQSINRITDRILTWHRNKSSDSVSILDDKCRGVAVGFGLVKIFVSWV